MKPLKINISAFGPYAEKEVIDFTTLKEKNFFLIHGPTGSGKTSVLDAICFALYGETSGGERKIKTIRSDYADIQDKTEITFEFKLGSKRYEISRSPEQERPKKRGEGTTRELSKADLIEIKGESRIVLADKWSKVTDEVKNILGFDINQFRQVVILPQGQFRKLLMADSSERQTILETLFQTGIYRKIEERLKEAAKEIKDRVEDFNKTKTIILDQAEKTTIEALLTAINDLEKDVAENEASLIKLKNEEKDALKNLENAKEISKKIEEKNNALSILNKLKETGTDIDKKKTHLDNARKAELLKEAERNLLIRQEEAKTASVDYEAAEKTLKKTIKEKEETEKNYFQEKTRTDEIYKLRRDIETLEKNKERFSELEKVESDLTAIVKKTESAEKNLGLKKEALLSLTKEIEKNTDQFQNISTKVSIIETSELKLEKKEKELETLKKIIEADKRKETAEKELKKQQKAFQKKEETFKKEKEAFKQIESDWLEGQAVILSEKLIENQPCPVCGSTDHPNPATSEKKLWSEETIKLKREAILKQDEALKNEEEKVSELNGRFLSLKTEVETLSDNKGSDKNIKDLQKIIKELKQVIKKSKEDQETLKTLKPRIEKSKDKENQLKTEVKTQEEAVSEFRQKREMLSAVCQEKKKNIHGKIKTTDDVDKEIALLQKTIEDFNKNYQLLEKKYETSLKTVAASHEKVSKLSENLSKASQISKETLNTFNKTLSEKGFSDFEAYKKAVLSTSGIESLDREISLYKETLKAAEDRFERADKNAEDHKKPDINDFQNRFSEFKTRVEEAVKIKSRNEQLIKDKKRQYKHYKEIDEKTRALEKEYAVTGRLSEVANGKNAQGMTFQRFVLATLLEDVLSAACVHLKSMSRGRFNLLRSTERTDMRIAGGLDLTISDTYTGTIRPVNTLSGGESFLASLSLALGLADVVQSYAGGIKLDTIFIDEGFGSLDPETLDLAFKTFSDLKDTGRLIGIISHVPELKERITTRLEIIPGKRGSTARFIL